MGTEYHKNASAADSHQAISDSDNDTKVQCEASADEDIIRFMVAAIEKVLLNSSKLDLLGNNLDLNTGSLIVNNGSDVTLSATELAYLDGLDRDTIRYSFMMGG